MALPREQKENFLPYPTLIVRKLFLVPDHCLPIYVPLDSNHAHHLLKLTHIQSRTDIYRCSFLPETIVLWNNLDIQDIDQISLTTYKDNCDRILKNLPSTHKRHIK